MRPQGAAGGHHRVGPRRLPRAHLRRAVGHPAGVQAGAFAPLVGGFAAVAATIEALATVVDEGTAALILEPIQGESGVHVLPDELLRFARERCDEVGATLIFDEIQTGLGRAGTAWAYEHAGVVPDSDHTPRRSAGACRSGR